LKEKKINLVLKIERVIYFALQNGLLIMEWRE